MKELELKHLAPYLPYGLKVIENDTKQLLMSNCGGNINEVNIMKVILFNKIYKPIFRPLSNLTKQIEVNGEKFIPIVVLMEFHEDEELDQFNNYKLASKYGVYGVSFTDIQGIDCSFAYHENLNMFGVMTLHDRRMAFTHKQYELFQKLFEWHFDVFGLIKNNLAIDINTL